MAAVVDEESKLTLRGYDEKFSEELSNLLRHSGPRRKVPIRIDGFARISDVKNAMRCEDEQIRMLVQHSCKMGQPRFQIGGDEFIRATRKHSISVDQEWLATAPEICLGEDLPKAECERKEGGFGRAREGGARRQETIIGEWQGKSSNAGGVIDATSLTWWDGTKTNIEFTGPKEITMTMEGESYGAKLKEDGKLHWDDGTVWTSIKGPMIGEWQGKSSNAGGIIDATSLTWWDGTKTNIEFNGPKELTMTMDGETYGAKLKEDGKLHWDDGTVWTNTRQDDKWDKKGGDKWDKSGDNKWGRRSDNRKDGKGAKKGYDKWWKKNSWATDDNWVYDSSEERRVHPNDEAGTPYTWQEFLSFHQNNTKKAQEMWDESTRVETKPVEEDEKPAPLPPWSDLQQGRKPNEDERTEPRGQTPLPAPCTTEQQSTLPPAPDEEQEDGASPDLSCDHQPSHGRQQGQKTPPITKESAASSPSIAKAASIEENVRKELEPMIGEWQGKSLSAGGVIDATSLTWWDGTKTSIEFNGPNRFAMTMDGESYGAQLKEDGKLHWDDGTVWTNIGEWQGKNSNAGGYIDVASSTDGKLQCQRSPPPITDESTASSQSITNTVSIEENVRKELEPMIGGWQGKSSSAGGVIDATSLTWWDGTKTNIEFNGPKVMTMTMGGETYGAQLKEDGKLHWDDGTVWTSIKGPMIGEWQGKSSNAGGYIDATSLTWWDGTKTNIEFKGPKKITMTMDGETYGAQLKEDGNLHWDDGTVWTSTKKDDKRDKRGGDRWDKRGENTRGKRAERTLDKKGYDKWWKKDTWATDDKWANDSSEEKRVHPDDGAGTAYTWQEFLSFQQNNTKKAQEMWDESHSMEDKSVEEDEKTAQFYPWSDLQEGGDAAGVSTTVLGEAEGAEASRKSRLPAADSAGQTSSRNQAPQPSEVSPKAMPIDFGSRPPPKAMPVHLRSHAAQGIPLKAQPKNPLTAAPKSPPPAAQDDLLTQNEDPLAAENAKLARELEDRIEREQKLERQLEEYREEIEELRKQIRERDAQILRLNHENLVLSDEHWAKSEIHIFNGVEGLTPLQFTQVPSFPFAAKQLEASGTSGQLTDSVYVAATAYDASPGTSDELSVKPGDKFSVVKRSEEYVDWAYVVRDDTPHLRGWVPTQVFPWI